MNTFSEIHFYAGSLDVKRLIRSADLENTDEALYVCDLSTVADKYRTWKKYLPRVEPYYAIKCNDDHLVVKMLAELGAGFYCASKNEIKQVLEANVSPSRIIFANPCKFVSHLEYANQQNITTGTVDSEFEIYKFYKNCPQSNLVVRFRSDSPESVIRLGDKFGCDADNDAAALMLLAKSLQLNVTGASFHMGSGYSDLSAYDRAITTAGNLFKFGQMLDFNMKFLNIGGGFPGCDDGKFVQIAKIVNDALEREFPSDEVKIIAEPGRFFVATSYLLICKIHAKREVYSCGKLDSMVYYINDGLYGSFNGISYDSKELTVHHLLGNNINLPTFKSLIWGPTCDSYDKITEDLSLPYLSVGDYIVFPNMGAYTVTVGSPFNGFLGPRTYYCMQEGICSDKEDGSEHF